MREPSSTGTMLRSYFDQIAEPVTPREAMTQLRSGMTAPSRGWRRHRPVAVSLVGVAIVAMIGLGLFVLPRSTATAGVAVSNDGTWLTVRLTHPDVTAQDVIRALDAVGIAATVEEVPVSPSRTGMFVASSLEAAGPEIEFLGVDGPTYRELRVRAGFGGTLTLYLGRAARSGEAYQAGGNAYAPMEPFNCLPIWGVPADEAAAIIAEATPDIHVRWQMPSSDQSSMVEVDGASIHDRYVADAIAVASSEVVVYLWNIPGESRFASQPPNQSACPESGTPKP